MELLKVVNKIGVYVDICDNKTYRNAIRILNRQLKGFSNKGEVEYKLIIKNYDNLEKKEGTIVPGNSINNKKIYINFNNYVGDLAINNNIKNTELVIWISEKTNISIPYFLHFLFKEQNLYFVHSAGLSYKGKGILLPAFGGIGKTIFMSEALKNKDTKLLGDDLTLLSSKGRLFPYERPFCLYEYHQPLFPDYFKKNKVIYKKKNLFNRVIKKMQEKFGLNEYILDYELADPKKLFSSDSFIKNDNGVELDKVYILRRKLNIDDIEVTETDINFTTNFIINVIFHEWWKYLRMEYRWLAEKGASRSQYLEQYEKGIKKGLKYISNFSIINIPKGMSPQDVSEKLTGIILS